MMTQLNIQIRWMIRRDMEDVLWIDRNQFEFPMGNEELTLFLRGQIQITINS